MLLPFNCSKRCTFVCLFEGEHFVTFFPFSNPHFYLEQKKLQPALNQSQAPRLILLPEALLVSEVVSGIKQQLLDPRQRTAENNTEVQVRGQRQTHQRH